ncbi:major tail protein [Mycobacterium phage MyraDee]|uniref:Major tail protein n=1 Tax=Mycobacterium phage MyraDee TaxID=2024303 RepID=A0A222YXV3_9CAUD|nr:major tail protein [Mycobacterium phage MyraDee]ASR77128.1 major tail protein [Mycobacterium phage MyraDee]
MALNDDAVITAAVGYLFTAPPGTAAPTPQELDALNLETFATLAPAWEQIGHTSRDDMPEFGYDGGETEVRGTWQKKRLREVESGDPVADSVTVVLEQFDLGSLELYYGENASTVNGEFGVDGNFKPVERAFLVIIVDGETRIGFYAAKASIKRDDSIDLPVDGFAGLPVKATFLDMAGQLLYKWISKALLTKPTSGGGGG